MLEEMVYQKAPVLAFMFIDWAARAILNHGNEWLRHEFLPRIGKGEVTFWEGLSEPNAGSDLLALETRAVESGDYFIITGQKTWNSWAHIADYGITLARTDTEAPRHKGLSAFFIDMKLPGITVRPIPGMTGETSYSEIFFDEVRLPKHFMIGQKNQGFPTLLAGLEADRLWGRGPVAGGFKRNLEKIIAYVKQTGQDKDPVVRQQLAEVATEIEVARLFGYRAAWMLSENMNMTYEASMVKTFADELGRKLYDLGLRMEGLYSQLMKQSPYQPLKDIVHEYLFSYGLVIAGGTPEIQRNTIATRGLGLPRG